MNYLPAVFFLYLVIVALARYSYLKYDAIVKAEELRETDEYVALLKKWNREKNGYRTDTPSS